MSSKKSRLDLLVRVRFLNPIPQPPLPPKLFDVKTDVHRLGEPAYLDHLASSTPLPMLVDGEMGMPLNLNAFDKVWEGDDSALNPKAESSRAHDPIDTLLLAPVRGAVDTNGETKPTTDVSWMRNSNLFTRKIGTKKKETVQVPKTEVNVDTSLATQIMTIDKSFSELTETPMDDMRHPDPKKRSLRVIETYDILPDMDTWGNTYYLMKYPERPTASTATNPAASADSSRLANALLRPVREDDQQLMEYYLPQEDHVKRVDEALQSPLTQDQLEDLRSLIEEDPDDPRIDEMFRYAMYNRIRTYEIVSQARPDKEVLLAIDERPTKRSRGAYYKTINMRTALRKTRISAQEVWDKTRVGFRENFEDETAARHAAAKSANEPGWVNDKLRELRGTNEMEGLGEAI